MEAAEATMDEKLITLIKGIVEWGEKEILAADKELILFKQLSALMIAALELEDGEPSLGDYEAPLQDIHEIRDLVSYNFPHFGYYNVPESLKENIGDSALLTGDAVDDLADIIKELGEVLWLCAGASPEYAQWHFKFNFRTHWASHLSGLIYYVSSILTSRQQLH